VSVEIRALVWDEANEQHMAGHGVSVWEIAQMLSNPHVIVRNRRKRSTRHLLIGSTHGGRILTVPLAQTADHSTWRPVTAFPATKTQQQVLARALSPVDKE
jgi:uncharacterized DUF497 family protein